MFESVEQSSGFAARMQAWAAIDSPHVLKVREGQCLADGTVLLVTDFPAGTCLREWLNEEKRMDPARVRGLGLELLDGLRTIHGAGAVHGDVKPNTIFIGKPGASQLVDGGITSGLWESKHLGDKTALIGTPFYAPVEQFGGESPDVRSDVYNVATVLYELCTGVVPWPGKSFLEVFQSKLQSRPPRMAERAPGVSVPAALEEAIVGGLIAEARDRYASAEKFAQQLEAVRL
ncbi:MAG: protein kinase [Planctomycetes bacterium]|nr:protein kinase [Planctomycetota bacterium]